MIAGWVWGGLGQKEKNTKQESVWSKNWENWWMSRKKSPDRLLGLPSLLIYIFALNNPYSSLINSLPDYKDFFSSDIWRS